MAKDDTNGPVTLRTLNEAVDAILEGMGRMVGGLRNEMKLGFKSVDERLKRLERGQQFLIDDINGLKAEFSDTPSRRQFENLKSRVDKHHPSPKSL